MFCPYCGNACADAHKFCFRCGNSLPVLTNRETITPDPAAQTEIQTPESIVVPVEETQVVTEAQTSEFTEPEESPVVRNADSDEVLQEAADVAPVPPVIPAPQPKKGRLWPPLLALIIMTCIGLGAFFTHGGANDKNVPCFTVEDGVLYFDYNNYRGPNELTVPDTVDGQKVTGISDGCFADCDGLTTVILPATVTKIGSNAFTDCESLRGVYIPEGVTTVGAGAFAGCTNLEALYFPNSIAAVGNGCLDRCEKLRYLFYDGTYDRWLTLYQGTYPSGMELHTADGVFYAQP